MSQILAEAVERGDLEQIAKQVALGDDPNWEGSCEQSLLSLAIASWSNERKRETVRLLLELGADPNRSNGDGFPGVDAIFEDDLEIMRLLLEHGLNPNRILNGPTESLYDLAMFDYFYEQYLADDDWGQRPRPKWDGGSEEDWLAVLEDFAEKHQKSPPTICRLLRSHGAKRLSELCDLLEGDPSSKGEDRPG